jgi:hypothetical protein
MDLEIQSLPWSITGWTQTSNHFSRIKIIQQALWDMARKTHYKLRPIDLLQVIEPKGSFTHKRPKGAYGRLWAAVPLMPVSPDQSP